MLVSWLRRHLPAVVSAVSALFLCFVLGLALGYLRYPPSQLVGKTMKAVDDLKANGSAYFLGVPIQHLGIKRFAGDGVVVSQPERMAPGVTFVTGLFGNRLGARLYAADGTLLHEWPIDFFKVAPEVMSYPFDALIHGDLLYSNGDFVVNLDGRSLMRVSACGDIVWQNHEKGHHSLAFDDEGYIWSPINGGRYVNRTVTDAPFNFNRIARFDPETGEKLEEIDLVDALIEADALGLILANTVKLKDMMHLNDVEVLTADKAEAFPQFSAGDLLLSSRHYNQIWVLDGQDHSLKWWFAGPMIGQHDPDFQPDGRITVLDNRPGGRASADPAEVGDRGGSRILSIAPETKQFDVLYASSERNSFYTPYRGKHQLLDNGNILITETDAGRVFEVTPEGEVVWSFINAYDDTRVGWVMKATRLPESYASIGEITCP
jgi:hypothetical protein